MQVCILNVGGGMQFLTKQPRWECFLADDPTRPNFGIQDPLDQIRNCEQHANSGDL